MKRGVVRSFARSRARLGVGGVVSAERRLLQVVDRAFTDAARRAGGNLVCRPGCDACCLEPFPVSRFDARLLRRGLAELRARDPDRANAIVMRARKAAVELSDDLPGDPATGRIAHDPARLDEYFARHSGRPCPALEPLSRTCELYDHRPIPCRTFGPPLRFGNENAPHCELCFRDADAGEIERCRVDPDPDDLEQAILRADGAPGDEPWETLIAFALAADR